MDRFFLFLRRLCCLLLPSCGWWIHPHGLGGRADGKAAFPFPFLGSNRSNPSFLLFPRFWNPRIVPFPSPTGDSMPTPTPPSTSSACGWDPTVRLPSPPSIPLWSWSIHSSLPHTQGPPSTTGTENEARNEKPTQTYTRTDCTPAFAPTRTKTKRRNRANGVEPRGRKSPRTT